MFFISPCSVVCSAWITTIPIYLIALTVGHPGFEWLAQ